MIPHTHKFPLRTSFVNYRTRAKRVVTPHTSIYYLPSTLNLVDNEAARLAVIVPKKVSKLATTRNSLKRLTYDVLWTQIKDQKIDMVVVFKPFPLKKTEKLKMELINELTQSIRSL